MVWLPQKVLGHYGKLLRRILITHLQQYSLYNTYYQERTRQIRDWVAGQNEIPRRDRQEGRTEKTHLILTKLRESPEIPLGILSAI